MNYLWRDLIRNVYVQSGQTICHYAANIHILAIPKVRHGATTTAAFLE